jgi:predicted ATPase/DNA-binding SARP family transcriptional activator
MVSNTPGGLKILTFGGLTILEDGKPVTGLASLKAEVLLVYLACQQRLYAREVLAELLWEDRTQSQSLANLRVVLSSLRKQLGEYVKIERDWVGLREEAVIWLDAGEFEAILSLRDSKEPVSLKQVEQVKSAVELYRGAFLEGVYIQGADGLTTWVEQEREHLHKLMARGLSWLAERSLQTGEYQEGIRYASRLVELDPLREAGQRQLMRLLALDGQRGAALSQYDRFRLVLAHELGVEPEAETVQIKSQIEAGSVGEWVTGQDRTAGTASTGELRVHPHNLPTHLTSFIGREREKEKIKSLLAGTHLLTLTGIGGMGKTRLALQVSEELLDVFPDGVWLVELAPLRDPGLVEQLVASILGLGSQSGHLLIDVIIEFIREQDLLIVLDNCEHLIDTCAQLADCLLRAVPRLKILATSRIPLNISGEVIYPLLPLGLPDVVQDVSPQDLMHTEAGLLFFERATSVQTTFRITEENVSAVAEICLRLDGIPLAIELAAARLRHLSAEQIASRLEDRFLLLTGGSRTALPRQQSLRAMLDWSYDLLTGSESRLFTSLSVFTGRFSLEAVESVCCEENDMGSTDYLIHRTQILDLLSALVDHSLVSVQERQAEIRYIMLETVREYALEKLKTQNTLPNLRDRHMRYYVEFAQQGYPFVRKGQPEWMKRFELEYDNLRSAMEYAISIDLEFAILFVLPLGRFCQYTARGRELTGWAKQILDLSEDRPRGKVRAMALFFAGDCAAIERNFPQAQALLEASLNMVEEGGDRELLQIVLQALTSSNYLRKDWKLMHYYAERHLAISLELGDNFAIGDAFWQLGESASRSGDRSQGRECYNQSLQLARHENDLNLIAFNLNSLAWLARQEGNTTVAKTYYMEQAEIRSQMGSRYFQASTWVDWGEVLLQEGDFKQALGLAKKSMVVLQSVKVKRRQIFCLKLIAGAAGLAGQDECAVRLFGASEAAAEKQARTVDFDAITYDPIIAGVRQRLGEADFQRKWDEGREMTLEQAVAYAMREVNND